VDVNRRTKLGESPGRAGVIRMNMAEEDMSDVVSRSTNLPKRSYDIDKVDSGPVSNSTMPSFVSSAVAAMMPGRPS
jgi:hypothetical protein